jgi:hypothetical protein
VGLPLRALKNALGGSTILLIVAGVVGLPLRALKNALGGSTILIRARRV